ncbi:MAG: hypothetical protein JNK64_18270 [Myxococcales bacterium]|nr:hypothetical protein [Myxococcales bacterium]
MTRLAVPTLLLSIAACASSSPAPRAAAPPPPLASDGTSGIAGTVAILAGNYMPPTPPGTPGPQPAAGAPVHILRGPHALMAAIDRGSADYVATVTTDRDGRFRVVLPAGTYTVLTEHDGAPYLNCFSGDGTWCTVTVADGAWSETQIVDSTDATF